MYAKSKYFSIYINWGIFYLVLIQRKGDNLRNLIVGDVLLLFFSIYVGIFFKKFHTDYPKMRVGFHIWEVCYNKEVWEIALEDEMELTGKSKEEVFELLQKSLDVMKESSQKALDKKLEV